MTATFANLCSTSIIAMGLLAMPAAAQTAAADDPQDQADSEIEIVVTGIRRSVESALEVKRESSQISDSIIAEDIGKLPDNTVTEALQRVTGVQISRAAGEGNTTLIRGLPNIVTTLNGRNVFTTTGRGIALQDIPADLLKRVDVYKTPLPENISGGIAGGINVELRRPLDFKPGLIVSASGRMVYSDEAGRADPILSAVISNRWKLGDGEIGIMLAASRQARHYQENNTFNGTYDLVADPGGSGTNVLRPFVIGGIYNVGYRQRDSYNGSLQWAPSDRLSFHVDAFLINFKNDNQLNFWIPLPGLVGTNVSTTIKPGSNVLQTISGGQRIADGVVTGDRVFTLTSNQAFANRSKTYQIAGGSTWQPTEQVTVRGDFAYTRSTAANRGAILDTAFDAPFISIDLDRNGASSAIVTNADGTPFDVTNPANFRLNQFFDQRNEQQGEEYAGMADIEYRPEGSFLSSLKAGLRYAKRDAYNQAANGGGVGFSGAAVFLNDPRLAGIVDVSPDNLLDGIATVDTTRFFVANREYLLGQTDIIRGLFGLPAGAPPDAVTNNFSDEEKSLAGFAQAGFKLDAGGIGIDGLVGLRVERTTSSLNGFTTTSNGTTVTTTPIAIDKTDTEYLPSANIRFKLASDVYLRFAAARTVTRPNFADLVPGLTLTAPGPTLPGAGTGGNPFLDNIKADAYDASLEWYFHRSSLLSAAVFRHDIQGYVVRQSVDEFYPNAAGDPQRFSVNRPFSSGSGRLQGVELGLTHFFDYLPGALSGFGVQLNGTYIDGKLNGLIERTTPFPLVSKYAYNAILIYEKGGFSSRLAYNWRDKYFASFSEFQNVASNNLPSVIQAKVGYLDYSASYRVNENFLLSFDATNLLKTKLQNYFGGPGNDHPELYPRDIVATDRTFSIGVRLSY
ncbi:TonB-dependent receptor [Sphingomonas sp. PB4P5]|uniref:TonB-dependent receptor n=1 Tax=Parasphingomonas puruogangriensis TaxID=3096155 RepID=UPI002FC5D82C